MILVAWTGTDSSATVISTDVITLLVVLHSHGCGFLFESLHSIIGLQLQSRTIAPAAWSAMAGFLMASFRGWFCHHHDWDGDDDGWWCWCWGGCGDDECGCMSSPSLFNSFILPVFRVCSCTSSLAVCRCLRLHTTRSSSSNSNHALCHYRHRHDNQDDDGDD